MVKRFRWQPQVKNKYYHLLAILIAFFFIAPFALEQKTFFSIFSLIFLFGIIFSLRASGTKRSISLTAAFLVIAAFFFESFLGSSAVSGTALIIHGIPLLIYAVFLLFSIILLISKMFSASQVTSDTIAGGISVYLLFGILWTLLYYLIYLYDPAAFNFSSQFNVYSLFYFSFSTLTTLGYGDIHPINKLAMSLSNLEVITGQMYIAIFISRLVGLHIVTANK